MTLYVFFFVVGSYPLPYRFPLFRSDTADIPTHSRLHTSTRKVFFFFSIGRSTPRTARTTMYPASLKRIGRTFDTGRSKSRCTTPPYNTGPTALVNAQPECGHDARLFGKRLICTSVCMYEKLNYGPGRISHLRLGAFCNKSNSTIRRLPNFLFSRKCHDSPPFSPLDFLFLM